MLRPNPQPLGEVCLSIDVGSVNAGICLFDGHVQAQTIMLLMKRALLDQHAYVVHDVSSIVKHLDDISTTVQTLLNGRPYWVLIEQQYFDTEAKAGLVFPLQLESCVAMYFAAKGVKVKTIHATARYGFLGIEGWRQDNRYTRKQKVVNEINKLLDPGTTGNQFAARNHDLAHWFALPPTQRHDAADALSQCLAFYYRNKAQVLACNPAPPVVAAASTNLPNTMPQLPSYRPQQRSQRQPKPSKGEIRGLLERMRAQSAITYPQSLRGQTSQSRAFQLYTLHQQHPSNRQVAAFMESLDHYNGQGTNITDQLSLEARLGQVLT